MDELDMEKQCRSNHRGRSGYRVITAPATAAGSKYGYVFADCYIDGDVDQNGKYHLGRPWKNAPRCVFLNCSMNVTPSPEGWCEMHGTVPALFAEYNSTDGYFSLLDLSKRKQPFVRDVKAFYADVL